MTPPDADQQLEPIERHHPDITEQMERFVHEVIATPKAQAKAAIRAGYSPRSAGVTASRLMRHPAVLRALFEEVTKHLGASLPLALQQVVTLSSAAKSEYVRLEASKDLLDRAGLAAPKRHVIGGQLSVSFDLSDE